MILEAAHNGVLVSRKTDGIVAGPPAIAGSLAPVAFWIIISGNRRERG